MRFVPISNLQQARLAIFSVGQNVEAKTTDSGKLDRLASRLRGVLRRGRALQLSPFDPLALQAHLGPEFLDFQKERLDDATVCNAKAVRANSVRSNQDHAPVRHDDLPGDVIGIGGCEERRNARNIPRLRWEPQQYA
jgi:hypothetical protein